MTISFNDLKIVNAKINEFPYKTELVDSWIPITITKEDDCDSYATAKQYRLFHTYGWPERSLRLACCFVEGNEEKKNRYHLVLLVDFEGKTYVLDNRHSYPIEYSLLPYEWHKFWNYELNTWEWAKNADKSFS